MFVVMKTFVSYLSFYWKKWFYIWYMALAWWLVLCLPFPGLPHIYFLFTVRLTNEWVGVFLAWRSVQHLVNEKVAFLWLKKVKTTTWQCFYCLPYCDFHQRKADYVHFLITRYFFILQLCYIHTKKNFLSIKPVQSSR
jgi:hypothetical protein